MLDGEGRVPCVGVLFGKGTESVCHIGLKWRDFSVLWGFERHGVSVPRPFEVPCRFERASLLVSLP